jgi:3'(2'), 5'-bisphosphate nucleotidase
MLTIHTEAIIHLCRSAGQAVMRVYENGETKVNNKKDSSPVTEADLISDQIIQKGLRDLYPEIPVISEEDEIPDFTVRKKWKYFWLIDPLDGTSEFIHKTGEFSIHVALIDTKKVVAGFVHLPFTGITYYAMAGQGAFRVTGESVIRLKSTGSFQEQQIPRITISRFHQDKKTMDYINKIKLKELVQIGSSLKILWIAEGKADVYPRFSNLREWDIAAPQIILEEAGGSVISFYQKKPLTYNRKSLRLPAFLALPKKF